MHMCMCVSTYMCMGVHIHVHLAPDYIWSAGASVFIGSHCGPAGGTADT